MFVGSDGHANNIIVLPIEWTSNVFLDACQTCDFFIFFVRYYFHPGQGLLIQYYAEKWYYYHIRIHYV